jgi:hypothetical protein
MNQLIVTFERDLTAVELDELMDAVMEFMTRRVGATVVSYQPVDYEEYCHEVIRVMTQMALRTEGSSKYVETDEATARHRTGDDGEHQR